MKYICRIGKNPSNDIIVQDRTVDDFHAQLIINADNEVWIKDLDSKFGVWVNNERVGKKELFTDDEVRIGFSAISWNEKAMEWLNLKQPKLEEDNRELVKKSFDERKEKALQFQPDSVSKELALQASGIAQPEYNRQEFEDNSRQEIDLPSNDDSVNLPEQADELPQEPINNSTSSKSNSLSSQSSEKNTASATESIQIIKGDSILPNRPKSLKLSDIKLIAFVLLGLVMMLILGWFLAWLS